MPLKEAKDPGNVKPQCLAEFKWQARNKKKCRFYDAFVLKISGYYMHIEV